MKKETSSNAFAAMAIASFFIALGSVYLFSYLHHALPEWGKFPSALCGFLTFVSLMLYSVASVSCVCDALKREKEQEKAVSK